MVEPNKKTPQLVLLQRFVNFDDIVSYLLCKYSFNEINELRYNVARYATSAKLRKTSISSICKELVEISYYSLKTQLEDEEKFLEPIMELLKKGKTPCEV